MWSYAQKMCALQLVVMTDLPSSRSWFNAVLTIQLFQTEVELTQQLQDVLLWGNLRGTAELKLLFTSRLSLPLLELDQIRKMESGYGRRDTTTMLMSALSDWYQTSAKQKSGRRKFTRLRDRKVGFTQYKY